MHVNHTTIPAGVEKTAAILRRHDRLLIDTFRYERRIRNRQIEATAIDVQAKLYLPQMFGSGSFRILPHPTHLVRGLSEAYGQLAH